MSIPNVKRISLTFFSIMEIFSLSEISNASFLKGVSAENFL